ncbi:MAG: signal recognition particle protein [Gammaproteobacteria bacterium]|nr:signal recognition particle protein [Gammaproteobacteria bacterium]MCY4226834.1 signal recognition particle protein [Gammaproteobacteria bacterium]
MFSQLGEKLRKAVKTLAGKGRLTESNISDALREVRVALLEADVSLEAVQSFIGSIRERAVGTEVIGSLNPGEAVIKLVHEELVHLMGDSNDSLNLSVRPPAVIFLAGLQGAGKTTTAGKLGGFLSQRENKSVLLTSTDVRRPAAIEQLSMLASNLSLEFFPSSPSQNPVDIAREAVDHARKKQLDVVIVDTAGRLHVDAEMMQEVQQLHSAINPVETLFVVDSMTGQDAVNSARSFNQSLPLTGVILTKTDGDARGGAALSIRYVSGKPIKFLGTGEAMDALEAFHPDRIASRILGMGDVLTLIEEVSRKVDKKAADKIARKIQKGVRFNLADYRQQMLETEKIGGLGSMMEKLPGMDQIPQQALDYAKNMNIRQKVAIINSMTHQERDFPAIIRAQRIKRIAAGSGTKAQDVNKLLREFQKVQKIASKIKSKSGMQRMVSKFEQFGRQLS